MMARMNEMLDAVVDTRPRISLSRIVSFMIFAVVLATLTAAVTTAKAEKITTPHNYHWQQTNFTCGTASIEMMLDSPAVRNNNVNVDNMFINSPGDGNLVNGVQAQIYQASRDRRNLLINNFGYVGYSPGTDPIVFSYTINAYDGIANGPALPGGVAQGGNLAHSYGWYGYFPNIYSGDQAMRTVAYALKNFQVPATAAVNHGGHWVVVNGVTTVGNVPTPANPNSQFAITGVYVADPWTGYAKTHGEADKGLGIGGTFNGKDTWNWMSYRSWFQAFNPVGGGLGTPYPFSGQYNIVIEPPDTYDVPFDIDTGNYSSEPTYTALPSALTSSEALSSALTDLGGDFSYLASDLDGTADFTGGSWDMANIAPFSFPGDAAGIHDWLIPYIGPGGADDVLGAIVVNAIYGTIDHGMWLGDDADWTHADLADYYTDLFNLDLPLDTPQGVPEPATGLLFLLGAICAPGFLRRSRQ